MVTSTHAKNKSKVLKFLLKVLLIIIVITINY